MNNKRFINVIFFCLFIVSNQLHGMEEAFTSLIEEIQPSHIPTKKKDELIQKFISNNIKKPWFDINFQTKFGQTLLHIAAAFGLPNTASFLLKKSDTSLQDIAGNTFLHLTMIPEKTIIKGDSIKKLVIFNEFLKNADSKIVSQVLNTKNNDGTTPFLLLIDSKNHFAPGNPELTAKIVPDLIENIEKSLQKGANPNIQNNEGDTALTLAFKNDFPEIISTLLKHGAIPYQQDLNKENIFHMAVKANSQKLLQRALIAINYAKKDLLLTKQMLNQKDIYGNTPLYKAVSQNAQDIINKLLEFGADPNIANKDGFTPLHRAIALQLPLVVEMLLDYLADPSLRTTKKTKKKRYNPTTKKYEVVEIIEEDQDTPLEMAKKITVASIKLMNELLKLKSEQPEEHLKKLKSVEKAIQEGQEIQRLLIGASKNFPKPSEKQTQPRITHIALTEPKMLYGPPASIPASRYPTHIPSSKRSVSDIKKKPEESDSNGQLIKALQELTQSLQLLSQQLTK